MQCLCEKVIVGVEFFDICSHLCGACVVTTNTNTVWFDTPSMYGCVYVHVCVRIYVYRKWATLCWAKLLQYSHTNCMVFAVMLL